MNLLKDALNDVMTKRINFGNMSVNAKVGNKILTKNDINIKEFLESLNKFYTVLKYTSISDQDLRLFVKENNMKFEKIKSTLVSKNKEFFKNIYDQELINAMKSIYDKIFINTRYKQQIINLEADATRYFTNFAKGITYFDSSSKINKNFIEENASCGSEQQPSNQHFTMEKFAPKKHKLIYRCLLERLIYDKIYQNTLRMQDLGHKFELDNIQKIYDNYFPDKSLKIIKIDYTINEDPYNLIFGFYNKDKLIEKRTYTKSFDANNLYEDNVECTKEDYISNKYYEKIQTFIEKKDWKEFIKDLTPEAALYTLRF
jgi:hypothetical protein